VAAAVRLLRVKGQGMVKTAAEMNPDDPANLILVKPMKNKMRLAKRQFYPVFDRLTSEDT
jgi:nucleotidyltransferase/DNA polymerase involved in DNA repair